MEPYLKNIYSLNLFKKNTYIIIKKRLIMLKEDDARINFSNEIKNLLCKNLIELLRCL